MEDQERARLIAAVEEADKSLHVSRGVSDAAWKEAYAKFDAAAAALNEYERTHKHRATCQPHPWRSDPQSDAKVRAAEDREAAKKPPTILHRDIPDVVASLLKRVDSLVKRVGELEEKLRCIETPGE